MNRITWIVLGWMALLAIAQAEELTGDYQVTLNEQSQKTVTYHCNHLNVYVNNGGRLDGEVTCNGLSLSVNGGGRVAFEGSVPRVDVQQINGMGQADLKAMAIEFLHVAMVNGGAVGYFKVSNGGQVDLVNGKGVLYIRDAGDSSTLPTVHVHEVNGEGEIHWCGVNLHADIVQGGGQVIEDCSW
jgi:hypothetical protein